ncbi:hypothetical protein [Nitrosomonas sp. Is79A3]|uniref:hypothetical protein n=1 Tax=Nitrosomonas sp. (strain Is79A3) TaxID=261292 RepID=UPI00329940EF
MKFQGVGALQKQRTLRNVFGRRARQQHRNDAVLTLLNLAPQRCIGFGLLVRADAVCAKKNQDRAATAELIFQIPHPLIARQNIPFIQEAFHPLFFQRSSDDLYRRLVGAVMR